MSIVVVAGVALLVFLYVRASRSARRRWLVQLDLPGTWHWEQGDAELQLTGDVGGGQFVLREGGATSLGSWTLHGHTLTLEGANRNDFDLQFFKPGSIGLTAPGEGGERRIYVKQTSNVVPLKRVPH